MDLLYFLKVYLFVYVYVCLLDFMYIMYVQVPQRPEGIRCPRTALLGSCEPPDASAGN